MARLTKDAWLDHGLEVLASQGFVALKADVLAKSLRVSRGSFYHHFEDLAAYHAGVLDHWLQQTVVRVVQRLEAGGESALVRLESLIDLVAASSGGLEQAVRAWAFSSPEVREALVEVDRQRVAYVSALFHEAGLPESRARRAALVLYMSAIGQVFLGAALDEQERRAVRDELKASARSLVEGTGGTACGAADEGRYTPSR